jgi:hypothetical protein
VEPFLDETSLVPCAALGPATRLRTLATTLAALDDLGAPRVLRSVRDAMDRDLGSGKGLRGWCFDPSVHRDLRTFITSRLGKQPFIDGDGGLLSASEADGIVEASARGARVHGLGLAAMTGGIAVGLDGAAAARSAVPVTIAYLDDAGYREESVQVTCVVAPADVSAHRAAILEILDLAVTDGSRLIARATNMFPRLRFGPGARKQIAAMLGSEPVFRQLLRHLRALDLGARDWAASSSFAPSGGLSWSPESKATLDDGKLGPMRDFAPPDGFAAERWSLHTKLTGGAGARLYFRPERLNGSAVVLIGYFGDHLPTTKYR